MSATIDFNLVLLKVYSQITQSLFIGWGVWNPHCSAEDPTWGGDPTTHWRDHRSGNHTRGQDTRTRRETWSRSETTGGHYTENQRRL